MTSYGNADHIRGSCSMMIPSKNLGAKPLWDVRASDDMCQLGGMDDFPKADSVRLKL